MPVQVTDTETPPIIAAPAARSNWLLGFLPEQDYRRISPHLRQASLRSRQVLLRQGQPVQEIIFPAAGVCSLVRTTEDGHAIEIVGIGAEGAVGASVALGQIESSADVVVQMSDEAAVALPLEVFQGEIQRRGEFASVMAAYCRTFTMQLMRAGACNALHSAEERCCRWLLTTQDRVQLERLPITQEVIATTLGLRRPTVTLIMADLSRAGLVDCGRGAVTVVDRAGLITRACACYSILSPGSASPLSVDRVAV